MLTKDKQNRILYIGGMILLTAVVLFILAAFSMLRNPAITDNYLMDTKSSSYGWSYEILQEGKSGMAEPKFLSEYSMYFPGMNPEAIRITRILTEEMPSAELKLNPYGAGVEVFLEERLLYSDFQTDERDEAGFLLLTQEELNKVHSEFRTILFSLPEDYKGQELCVITYFKERSAENAPVFPILTCGQVEWAMASAETVLPIAILTLCAVLVVMLCILFVLDLSNGKPDCRILLLIMFFLLLFLDKAYESMPGSYSILMEKLDLSFLTGLYIAPLCLYLALHLRGKRLKYVLCGCTVLWFLYEIIFSYRIRQGFLSVWYDQGERGAFFLFAFMISAMGIERLRFGREERRSVRWYEIVLFCVSLFSVLLLHAEDWNGDFLFCIIQMVKSLVRGNCSAAVRFLSSAASVMATLVLIVEFIRRTYQNQVQVRVLEERSRYAMESYERMLSAEEATNAVRHEMRHHLTVLRELFRSQDAERAGRYLDAMETELHQIPTMRYSRNTLVNVIGGTYLDQAKELGIQVEHQFLVPENLNMADEDLCVFLSNMLENALNACKRIAPDQERFIRIVVHMEGNFLYIGCTNSVSDEKSAGMSAPERKENRRHGYGLAAMRKIAEKYGSVLKVDRSSGVFSVKSNLCLSEKSV